MTDDPRRSLANLLHGLTFRVNGVPQKIVDVTGPDAKGDYFAVLTDRSQYKLTRAEHGQIRLNGLSSEADPD